MRFEDEKENTGSSSGRVLLRYLQGIIWQSALLSILLSTSNYFFHHRHFHQEDVWITFVLFILCLSVITILGLLMEVGKNRKPNGEAPVERKV
jgi:hypothetical protein